LYSYRRLFIVGMSLFTLASLGCSIAANDGQLITVRLAQGVGSALMVPQVVALIQVVFPPQERPKALAWYDVTVGLASVAGTPKAPYVRM
jgi:MFS family permease